MKLSKLICVPLVLAALVCVSCADLFGDLFGTSGSGGGNTPGGEEPVTGTRRNFWAQKVDGSGTMYQTPARKLFEGAHCVIWGEVSANVTVAQAKKIANEYDQRIYRQMLDAFSMKNFDYTYEDKNGKEKTDTFANILDFAGFLVIEQGGTLTETDKKLTILMLDIQDGFKDPRTDSYTAGYFATRNFYPSVFNGENMYSNEKSMIYIDTYPSLNSAWVAEKEVYKTLAHELQHLINFATSTSKRDMIMDTWIDEGLSSQAEVVYSGAPLQNRIDYFNEDPVGTIAQGNNFFVWGNYDDHKPNAVLDEYATVYLFFRWLYLQAEAAGKQGDLLRRIETSGYDDFQAVTEAAANIVPDWGNWETLLKTWLAANYINNPNNNYGYRGDPAVQTPSVGNILSILLYPGEGVYSAISTSYTPPFSSSNRNIRYAGINKATSALRSTAPYTGNALLTFNMNTTKLYYSDGSESGSRERGYVTGNSIPVQPLRAAARSAGFDGPRRIDARDLMGWNGETKLFGFPIKTK